MAAGLGRCDQAKDFETERPLCSTGVGQIVTGVLIRGEEEIRDRQTERQREDAVLLVLKVEEKGPSLGMQAVSRSGERNRFSPGAFGRNAALQAHCRSLER